jgi:O-antigen ligase
LVRNVDRLASTADSLKKQDLNHRQNIWKDGIPLVIEHPVLGVGGGAFAQALKARHGMKYPAHNVYLSTIAELGIPGFFLYFGYVGLVIRAVRRSANPHRYFDLALLAGVMAALATANLEAGKQVWLIFALTLAHAKLYPAAQPEHSAPLLASSPHPAA